MEENNTDLVSILLPIHNASKYLKSCLESLLSQTYQHIEIIAIDDGSTDTSLRILKSYAKKDYRLKVFKNKKRYGLATCLNRGLKYANGMFLAFMDADDTAHREKIARQVAYLAANAKVAAVGTNCQFVNPHTSQITTSDFPLDHIAVSKSLFAGMTMQPETVMINKAILPKDLLKFQGTSYRFLPKERRLIYAESFLKILSYGEFNNLQETLYTHKNPETVESTLAFMKLWAKSVAIPDFTPSFKSLFFPLFNNRKPIFQ
jgi:glycosyltransferase involved in cell wall biosynthesis